MLKYSIKAISANKLKTFLIYISLTFAISAIFLIMAISNGVIDMYSSMLKSDGDIIVTQAKISDTFFSNVDVGLLEEIEAMNEVKKASAFIVGASPVEKLPIVAIYGCSTNRFANYSLKSGNYPSEGEVIVGKSIYRDLTNKTHITIADRNFTIAGVYSSKIGFENGGVVMNLSDAGAIFNKSASMLLVNIQNLAQMDSVIAQIQNLSEKIEVKSTEIFIDNYNQFKIIQKSSLVISLVAFIMGLITIGAIMSITVNQRRDEFGIIKALGISSFKIIMGLIVEAMILASIGFISALLISYGVLELIKNASSLQGYVNGEISLDMAWMIFATTLAMTILGSIIPAYSASKIDPIILIQKGSR